MDTVHAADLYPPIAPFASGMLAVGDGHRIYWEQCGAPGGIPVVYFHGGPGSGCLPAHRRFYDPDRYRIVLFDQRGCGRSAPIGETRANTTWDLIADIEALRRYLDIPAWLVAGGSWGTTLALAYGQTHPDRCLGFILRGVFLFGAEEVDWFLTGMGRFFPEAEARWRGFLPPDERADPLAAYARRLEDPDPRIHGPAAHVWNAYEHACSSLHGPRDGDVWWRTPEVVDDDVVALARLEVHYMRHQGFLAPGQLLAGVPKVAHLPLAVVQGRYDVVCPIRTAHRLVQAWPGASMTIVPDAGHSAFEPGTRAGMVRYADAFARNFDGFAGISPVRAFAL